ncbi:RcpC/CpaB family pilus assembly protein [Brevibacillus choshinensis]|uniref:RcpC/CpaB family pilus assembly protein n=1 Tax=Brevibacillus choshinensis TaxID=54911 RepID=UPI002E240716|nr:RcpC/CpaB family pilus assembly protein [Brevibacillus choshinensis]MED4754850.1 RcpC/CpaB family pilus assembly protein [Brevibacillus choshinensis]MED4781218.1 RcpC/CpaB family pilus assembly protein [Brevibacillus choshinensis]
MSVHPLRLLALLLLASCVGIGSYFLVKPYTVTYIQLRQDVNKESGQLLETKDIEPLVVNLGGAFKRQPTPIPGLLLWDEAPNILGKSLNRKVKGGRPLLESDLDQAGQTEVDTKLNTTKTGMSIPVDNVVGVTPHLSTGERVHVYASFEDDAGAHSGMLLQNMPIIGVQREMEGEQPNLVAVTLSLTRNEAVLLTHALHYGKIRLGLAAVMDGQKSGIGDTVFATDLMKTKKRWGNQEEERE